MSKHNETKPAEVKSKTIQPETKAKTEFFHETVDETKKTVKEVEIPV